MLIFALLLSGSCKYIVENAHKMIFSALLKYMTIEILTEFTSNFHQIFKNINKLEHICKTIYP